MRSNRIFITQNPEIEKKINESKERCLSMQLPDMTQALPPVTREMQMISGKNICGYTHLIRNATPEYYSRLTEILSINKSILFYISPAFDIYGIYGYDPLRTELKKINLRFAANLSESSIGTNAAALASFSGSGVWTSGIQNYAPVLWPYTFFAFKVHGTYNREVTVMLAVRTENVTVELLNAFKFIKATESLTSSGIFAEAVLTRNTLLKYNYTDSHTDNIFIIINSNGYISYVNNAFYHRFHTTYDEVVNARVDSIVPELSFVLPHLSGEDNPPKKVLRFDALGMEKYLVSCTRQSLNNSSMTITLQNLITEYKPSSVNPNGTKYSFASILGTSDKINELKLLADKVAAAECSVLIRGESGTGKELFAQSIHNGSPRKDKPFVSINCAAIPKDLIGSELFGYIGGAFTGANRGGAKGKFEQADGGTLFLDEIAEMPLDMQSVLLRVLEERTVTPLGGNKAIPVNVRVIAATNQNLENYIRSGAFRLDLFYRLNTVSFTIPPLRERREDILVLSEYFLKYFAQNHGTGPARLSQSAASALIAYDWPGNTRQLRNVIERLVVTTDSSVINENNLPPEIQEISGLRFPTHEAQEQRTPAEEHNAESREEKLRRLYRLHDGNKSRVAADMGVSRVTLYKLLEKYNIN